MPAGMASLSLTGTADTSPCEYLEVFHEQTSRDFNGKNLTSHIRSGTTSLPHR